MAGDWIKMRMELRTHPKVVRISSVTKSDKLRVVGALHAVWCLFDIHSLDGRLEGYTADAIDEYLCFPGFAAAMAIVGWLELIDGGVKLPEFDTHNGTSAKRRAEDAVRKASKRREQKVQNVSATDADKVRTREEKRREEKSTEEIHSAVAEEVPVPSVPEPPPAPVEPPKPKREPKPKPEPKPRERDPLFDAIVDATGVDAKTMGGRIGKICKLLREAEPPYTPEDVAQFARELHIHCDWTRASGRTRPELGEIQGYIGRIRAPAPPVKPPPPRPTPADDRTARLHAEGLRALEILASGEPSPWD